MTQQWIPAVFMRGGTSKGVFFREDALPAPGPDRDALYLSVMGSPDPYGRQLDGMGGGVSSLSKVVSVRPSDRPDADVEYTFSQVSVGTAVVDHSTNCGNLSSAVAPFALDEGLLGAVDDGPLEVRIFNTNTGALLRAALEVRGGMAAVDGDLAIPGVAGTGSPIRLDYLAPGGTKTGRVLPVGAPTTRLRVPAGEFTVSCVDVSAATVFVDAAQLGLAGSETPTQLAADSTTLGVLEQLRRAGAVAMGLATDVADVPPAGPKIAVVAAPADYRTISGDEVTGASYDLSARMISMEQPHGAIPGTGALCLAAAVQIPGTLPNLVGSAGVGATAIGTPSGVLSVTAEVTSGDGEPQVASASLFRTARTLMRGSVAVRG
ncbi:PrpF domain-containing protein [Rhodococcus gannanensis]|uniref:PrpF domain-containing protein n=1 Tax=Rhodococcus gannanensis TaxID=1960308 RepID=A0ABW4PD08_9NOCA